MIFFHSGCVITHRYPIICADEHPFFTLYLKPNLNLLQFNLPLSWQLAAFPFVTLQMHVQCVM